MRSLSSPLVSYDPRRLSSLRIFFVLTVSACLTAAPAAAQDWYAPAPSSPYSAGAYGEGNAYPPPPPPPAAAGYGQGVYAQGRHAPYPQRQKGYGYNPYAKAPYAQAPYAQAPYAQDPYAQDPYAQDPYAQAPYAQAPYAQAPYAQDPYAQDPYAQAPYAQDSYDRNTYPRSAYPGGPYSARSPSSADGPSRQGAYTSGGYPANAYPTDAYAQGRYGPGAPPPGGAGSDDGQPQIPAGTRHTTSASDQAYTPSPRYNAPNYSPSPDDVPRPPPGPDAAPAASSLGLTPSRGSAAPRSAALAARVIESASAYLEFMSQAAQISPAFKDPASIARELKTGASYEAHQFQEGAVAYAAIIALQEPSFVSGVRSVIGQDPGRVEAISASLIADPASALRIPGAGAAAGRASTALRRQGDQLMQVGVKVKQAAYDVQHSAWSKGDISQPAARLAAAKSLSSTRSKPSRAETDRLLRLALAEQAPVSDLGTPPTAAVQRGLALAALAVMGKAGDRDVDRLGPLLTEPSADECLKMAKLNLFQCMAVAGPHYEDIFCLGRHAMMDTAQCVIAAGGASAPGAVTAAPAGYWTSASRRP